MEITTKYSPTAKLVTTIVTSPSGQLRNTTTDRGQAIAWFAKHGRTSMSVAASTILSALRQPGTWVRPG